MDHCVTQFQYNYLGVEHQAGTRGLQYAAPKGLAVVIMEPLRGGALARSLVAQVREAYLSLCAIPCTGCQYCLPCPQGVAIPDVLGVYNEGRMFGEDHARAMYNWIDEKHRGDAYIECGECPEKCPQGIDIPEWMKVVHEALGLHKALTGRDRCRC